MSNKKPKLSVIILFALCGIGILFIVWCNLPKTPLSALKMKYMSIDENILKYSDLIGQVDLSSEESLLFYYNGKGNVNCAVAEKNIFGFRIVDVNAELLPYREDLRVGLYGSTYNKGSKWVYFGIIYDDSVKRVVWNNTEGIRFSSSDMDLVYAAGDGAFKGNEYKLYDAYGNELEHQR